MLRIGLEVNTYKLCFVETFELNLPKEHRQILDSVPADVLAATILKYA